MELPGKVVVLTGASRGIGKALSCALAESGCKLLLTAYEKDELAVVTEYLTSELGAPVISMTSDPRISRDPASLKAQEIRVLM